ncbi:hypothetical protein BaRGS_00025678, partial [Batillaria attramentaria]
MRREQSLEYDGLEVSFQGLSLGGEEGRPLHRKADNLFDLLGEKRALAKPRLEISRINDEVWSRK